MLAIDSSNEGNKEHNFSWLKAMDELSGARASWIVKDLIYPYENELEEIIPNLWYTSFRIARIVGIFRYAYIITTIGTAFPRTGVIVFLFFLTNKSLTWTFSKNKNSCLLNLFLFILTEMLSLIILCYTSVFLIKYITKPITHWIENV